MSVPPPERTEPVQRLPSGVPPGSMLEALLTMPGLSVRTGATIISVTYAMGLLVTNEGHIASAIPTFTVLKPQCVLTGAWSVVLVLAGMLPVDALFSLLRRQDGCLKLALTPFLCGIVLFCVVMLDLVLLWFLSVDFEYIPSTSFLGTHFRVPAGTMWIPAVFAVVAFLGGAASSWATPTRMHYLLVLGFGSLLSSWVVATQFFPGIPQQLGGGLPEIVHLHLKPEGVEAWRLICGGPAPTRGESTTGLVASHGIYNGQYILDLTHIISGATIQPSLIKFNKDLVLATESRQSHELQGESCRLY
jgi:hypothetical protein